ncbi:MAG: type 1 glutamine amidotransferase domain-containing protein [Nitrososphaerota archaeon]
MFGLSLSGKSVAILAGPDYEDLELHYPLLRFREEGAEVKVVAPTKELYKGKHGLSIVPDLNIDEALTRDFDILIIPGGWAPDRLRRDSRVVEFVKKHGQRRAIIGAICHGPQLLISAKLLSGKRATCVSGIKDDVINAGATFVDTPVVVDGNIITSRVPDDLPSFCKAIIEEASKLKRK